MQRRIPRFLAAGALTSAAMISLTACGSGFSGGNENTGGELTSSDDALTVLIAASGDAEARAVESAVAAWAEESGIDAEVSLSTDLPQQLSQGFAAGTPADVFYLSTDALAGYAANGSLLAYGDELANRDDFFQPLVDSFTYENDFYCAPKDFSTLALIINSDMWDEAGLSDADIPTNWDELSEVAAQLTTDEHVGLAFGPEYARVGAFMAQAGGTLTNADGTEATVNSPENLEGLTYVKNLITSGSAAFSSQIGAGWGGEAFGSERAAMTIEGNWIDGAMNADYPDVPYQVVQLPEGPAGAGTMQFSVCWGIAADSPNQEGALGLVEFLTSTEQQLGFAEAFGVMPSVESAAEEWSSANPDKAAFIDGADSAVGLPVQPGSNDVLADFNAQLESLADANPEALLDSAQANFEAILP